MKFIIASIVLYGLVSTGFSSPTIGNNNLLNVAKDNDLHYSSLTEIPDNIPEYYKLYSKVLDYLFYLFGNTKIYLLRRTSDWDFLGDTKKAKLTQLESALNDMHNYSLRRIYTEAFVSIDENQKYLKNVDFTRDINGMERNVLDRIAKGLELISSGSLKDDFKLKYKEIEAIRIKFVNELLPKFNTFMKLYKEIWNQLITPMN